MSKKILIVEDDVHVLTGMTNVLTEEGYEVVTATNGEKALSLHMAERPDLILLDVMMPEMDGYEVCKSIRAKDAQVMIIMLTSRQREADKVVGLEIGADDYIIKDTGVSEILARIKAALRRSEVKIEKKISTSTIKFSNVVIDPKTLKGKKEDQEFDVSTRELLLLQMFVDHDGEVLSRDMLLQEAWGKKYTGTTRTLDQSIVKLRQKIEDDPSNPKHLLTLYGEGYRFIKSP
jgi:DNA-binding response OmpR family regulator